MPQEQTLSLSLSAICNACRLQRIAVTIDNCGNPPFGIITLSSRFLDGFNQQLSAYDGAAQIGIGESGEAFAARVTQELISKGIKGVDLKLGVHKAWVKELLIRKNRRYYGQLLSTNNLWRCAACYISKEKVPELFTLQQLFLGLEDKVQPLMTTKGLVFRLTQLLPDLFNYLTQAIDEVERELSQPDSDRRRCIQIILSQLLQLQAQLKQCQRNDQAALLYRMQLAEKNKNLNDDDVIYDAMEQLKELGAFKHNPLVCKRSGTDNNIYQTAKQLLDPEYPVEVNKLCASHNSTAGDLFYLTRHYITTRTYYVIPQAMQTHMPVALPWYKRWFSFCFKGTHCRLQLFNDVLPLVTANHLMQKLEQQLQLPLTEADPAQVQLMLQRWKTLWFEFQKIKQDSTAKLSDKTWQSKRYQQTQACLLTWSQQLENTEKTLIKKRLEIVNYLLKYLQTQCANHLLGAKPQLDEDLFQAMQSFCLTMIHHNKSEPQQIQQEFLQSFKSFADFWRECTLNSFSIKDWNNNSINNTSPSAWLSYLKMFPEVMKLSDKLFNLKQQNDLKQVYQSAITSICQYYLSRLESGKFADVEASYSQVAVFLPFEDPKVQVMREACDNRLLEQHRQERIQLAKQCLIKFSQRYVIPLSVFITLVMPIYIDVLQLSDRAAEDDLLCELVLRAYHDAQRICRLQIRNDPQFALKSCQNLLYTVSHWRNQSVVKSIKADKGIYSSSNIAYERSSRNHNDSSSTQTVNYTQLTQANS